MRKILLTALFGLGVAFCDAPKVKNLTKQDIIQERLDNYFFKYNYIPNLLKDTYIELKNKCIRKHKKYITLNDTKDSTIFLAMKKIFPNAMSLAYSYTYDEADEIYESFSFLIALKEDSDENYDKKDYELQKNGQFPKKVHYMIFGIDTKTFKLTHYFHAFGYNNALNYDVILDGKVYNLRNKKR